MTVEEMREAFINRLVTEKGMDRKEAEEIVDSFF